MDKKNKVLRVIPVLLVLCLISTVMISGTFAKYTSEYSGQDTALVAMWHIVAFAGQMPGEGGELDFMDSTGTKALALFDHEYDIHMNQKDDGKFIIAPGVEGEFILALGNFSDVAADVEIQIAPLEENITVAGEGGSPLYQLPVEYSIDGGAHWVTLDNLAAAVVGAIVENEHEHNVGAYATGNDNVFRFGARGSVIQDVGEDEDEGDECRAVQIVQWRWPYEPTKLYGDNYDDGVDTAFGLASAGDGGRLSYGIKITVTATQVAPGKPIPITGIGDITGEAIVGQTLTAGAVTPEGATVDYQWLCCEYEDGEYEKIGVDDTGSTYEVGALEGWYIKVRATGTGNYTGLVESAAVGPVTPN